MTFFEKFYNPLINNKKLKRIFRFGSVGGLNILIDFGIFSLLNSIFGVNYVISQIISYSSGTLNSYIMNKFWTFNDTLTNKKTTKEIVQFIVVNSASLGVSLLGLSILMKNNFINAFLAKIISMILAQVVNFIGYRFWVFGTTVKAASKTKKIA